MKKDERQTQSLLK